VVAGPESFDRTRTTSRAAPKAWAAHGVTGNVEVVPLGDGRPAAMAGWCTYENTLAGGPDVEWILGGVNSKHPAAAAIWRQGFLLHFGFEPAPDQLNDNGKALLVNSIVYVARFRGDRPLLRIPSPFVAKDLPRARTTYLQTALQAKPPKPEMILLSFDLSLHEELGKLAADDLATWCRSTFDYLRAGPRGPLVVDQDAQALGVAIGTREGLEKCIAAAAEPDTQERALRVLARLVPDTGAQPRPTDGAGWQRWWNAHEKFLFFSEFTGQTWHVDPLARERGVPTSELRGPARGDVDARAQRPYKTGMLAPGAQAPDFSVPDETGRTRTLREFAGKHVVLWFFPKADTPG
jgi:hypothetical protein